MIIITIKWILWLFDYPNDSIKFYKIRDCSVFLRVYFVVTTCFAVFCIQKNYLLIA